MSISENNIVYSSNVLISDPAELASLCVFYDTVYMPFTSPETYDRLYPSQKTDEALRNVPELSEAMAKKGVMLANEGGRAEIKPTDWYRRALPLVKDGALRRLDKPKIDELHVCPQDADFWNLAKDMGIRSDILFSPDLPDVLRFVRMDLLVHLSRDDIEYPQVFFHSGKGSYRELAVAMSASMVLQYLVPRLNDLEVDDILELRRRVADTREGFAMHLLKLSKGIDGKLKEGESPKQIARWTRDIVETDLIPDYREFREQAKAGKSLLDRAGRAFEITLNPLSLKMYGDILRVLGVPIRSPAEQTDRRSNKSRAFQFMQAVEESKIAKYQRSHRGT